MIAQVAVETMSPSVLWIVGLLGAGSGLAGLVSVISLFATRREQIQLEKRVEKTELTLEDIRRGIAEAERRLNAASENRAKDTHDRINDVLEAIAELRGRFNQDHE